MTLDIAKFITNSIKNQAKIQHLDINVKTVKTAKIPESVSSVIIEEYGDQYLLDANYVAFFWGAITKDIIKRMFNVVDKALGQSANKLTDKDFKKIKIELDADSSDTVDLSQHDSSIDDDASDDIEDDANAEDDSIEDDIEDDSDETELNEDDSIASVKPSYFFLKITTK